MKLYFNNLNALRFFAASFVMIHHIEQLKALNGLANAFKSETLVHFGKLGVCLFFVLSGFLITSLLADEKQRFQKINIKGFYMRRILRIWPLYFLIVLLSLFILPSIHPMSIPQWIDPREHLLLNSVLMLLVIPNVQTFLIGQIPYAAQCWSIGVEEQFYLLWPLLVSRIRTKYKLKRITVLLIGCYLLFRITCMAAYHFTQYSTFKTIDSFLVQRFQIECILIGGLFALINTGPYKILFTSKNVQVFTFMALTLFVSRGFFFFNFYWEVYSIVFGLVILNLVNGSTIMNLEHPVLNYLGKISYGLYMWHYIVINVVIRFVSTKDSSIYLLSFFGTTVLAAISYHYFEGFFLRKKEKYETATDKVTFKTWNLGVKKAVQHN